MSRLPPRPQLSWTESSSPHADAFGDIYFSGDGLSETRAVFLEGCGLPEAWAGRETFVVGELGFGSGLNLLALWDLWRAHRPSPSARLHFVSFEGFPMAREDARRIHAAYPELARLSAALLEKWPVQARGIQRIDLPDKLTLTLHLDEIDRALAGATAQCDVWFLDGFAPSKNPDMWSEEAMAHVARLSAPGAIAATYTVAGAVRRNLSAAGFTVEKKPGHGNKRERLEARIAGERTPCTPPRTIAIIGAGIAGACAAHAFARRGCEVTVIDAGSAPGHGASGNPTALVMPRLDATDTPEARALISAWLYARRFYVELSSASARQLPATRFARADRDQKRFAKLLADPPLPYDEFLPLDDARSGAGYRLPNCTAVRPAAALTELIGDAKTIFNQQVRALQQHHEGVRVELRDTHLDVDLAIVCAGDRLPQLQLAGSPAITPRLGQIECATGTSPASDAKTDGGYVVEAFGDLVFGSTFEAADGLPQVKDEARTQNLETVARLRPDLDATFAGSALTSRAAIRATTADRMPFAGPLPTDPAGEGAEHSVNDRIQLVGGLGARGFLWAPVLAELIAAHLFEEPLPLESSVAALVDPDRFRRRAARRSG